MSSQPRGAPIAKARPYKQPWRHNLPSSTSLQHPRKPRRKGIWIASGLFIYALTTYTVYQYTSLTSPADPAYPLPAQDTDVSSRYNSAETAAHFDSGVSFFEQTAGAQTLRKRLASQAKGHVLEASVGTGRNAQFYDLEKCNSVTFVDQSRAMLEIAKAKWMGLHPEYKDVTFLEQSTVEALPGSATVPKEGFTTVLQTMGVCSTIKPAEALAHLGSLVDPVEGRILLLEHGRSNWGIVNWVLDLAAAKHADKHGCWPNRDIGKILRESGLVIGKAEKSQFQTLWYVEARPGARQKELREEREREKEKARTEMEAKRKGWLSWGKR